MIRSVQELEEWFAFTADYVDNNRGNGRPQYERAAAAANPVYTPEFIDAALVLFDEVIANPPPPPQPGPRPRGQGGNRPRPGGNG